MLHISAELFVYITTHVYFVVFVFPCFRQDDNVVLFYKVLVYTGTRGSVSGRALDFGLIGVSTCGFESHQGPFRSLTFPPVLRDWVIKGFGMSSLVYATGHIKDPVPLVEKSRGLSPGGWFPPCFIHQVIIITGLNKLQLYVLALKMALDADRA